MTSGLGSAGAPSGGIPSEGGRTRDDRTQEMLLPTRNGHAPGTGSGATTVAATTPSDADRPAYAEQAGVGSRSAFDAGVNSTTQMPHVSISPRPSAPGAPSAGPATAVLPTIGDAHPQWATSTDRPRLDPVPPPERSPSPAPAPRPQIRVGAGFGGFLAVAALAGIGVGMFALPLAGKHSTDYFHTLRAAATRSTTDHSSQAGHTVATLWWRYGALIGFGVLAFLVALSVATTRLRRTVATLLLVGALAAGALLAAAGYQTADPDKQSIDAKFTRVRIAHLQLGFWIALGCCALLALAALLSASRRRA